MLELKNISKKYPTVAQGQDEFILENVNGVVEKGQAIAITGPSGSGKSTLLNIIGALDKPSGGQVILAGEDITKLGEVEQAALRNQEIGFVFQLHHLLGQCTVLENVLIPTLALKSGGNNNAVERGKKLLERVGLGHRLDHRPGQLSGGEQQRVAVVRALINEPKLLLADEPTGSLDGKASTVLTDVLLELNQEEGITLIVATHSLGLAGRLGHVWQLQEKAIVEGGRDE